MTKITKLTTAFLAIILSIAFTGCKDDDPQPALEYQTEGTIKGKITGVSKDNSYTFNDDFTYSQYSLLTESYSLYQVNNDGSYDVSISRADFSTSGTASITFTLSNAADTTPDDVYISINYYKESNDKIINFRMNSSDDENTVAITDFTFDGTTGKAKGKFTLSGTENSTDKNATVSGDFEVTAKKEVQ